MPLENRRNGIPGTGERKEQLCVLLAEIWSMYFADVPRVNDVQIGYQYPWKHRLGLIRLSRDQRTSFIGVNSLLHMPEVPSVVRFITIAHELVHYTHGFGSPLPRIYKHPHANRVVDCELEARRLGEPLRQCTDWLDQHWYRFYEHALPVVSRRGIPRQNRPIQAAYQTPASSGKSKDESTER
jgi:hypothetical protein